MMLSALDSRLLAAAEWLVDFAWEWFSVSRRHLLRVVCVAVLVARYCDSSSGVNVFWIICFAWLMDFCFAAVWWADWPAGRVHYPARPLLLVFWLMCGTLPPHDWPYMVREIAFCMGLYLHYLGDSSKPRGGKRTALSGKLVLSGNPSVLLPEPERA